MKSLGRSLLATTAALLLTAVGFAQSNAAEFDANGNGGANSDKQFMQKIAQENMAKIFLAYLARQNAQNEQVKAYAQQVLEDYGKANAALADIATQQFVELPQSVDPKQQERFEALSQLQGAAFDKAYMEAMLNSQKTDVSRFKQEAAKGNNQSMVDWARQVLPTIESSYKEAQKVGPAVGVHATMTAEEQKLSESNKPAPAASPDATKQSPSPSYQVIQ
jgi:putative membrane protein